MAERLNPPLPTQSLAHARDLLVRQTEAENRLWYHLRGNRLDGAKFRRQHPIPPYIVDFYCSAAKLVIELDGSQHTPNVDAARTRFLEAQGIEVLRFWDNDVLLATDSVLARISGSLHDRTLTPVPSPGGRGEKGKPGQ